jgi:hypothetical protein
VQPIRRQELSEYVPIVPVHSLDQDISAIQDTRIIIIYTEFFFEKYKKVVYQICRDL